MFLRTARVSSTPGARRLHYTAHPTTHVRGVEGGLPVLAVAIANPDVDLDGDCRYEVIAAGDTVVYRLGFE